MANFERLKESVRNAGIHLKHDIIERRYHHYNYASTFFDLAEIYSPEPGIDYTDENAGYTVDVIVRAENAWFCLGNKLKQNPTISAKHQSEILSYQLAGRGIFSVRSSAYMIRNFTQLRSWDKRAVGHLYFQVLSDARKYFNPNRWVELGQFRSIQDELIRRECVYPDDRIIDYDE